MQLESARRRAAASLELPVRFVETDAMGVVHHSNYLVWFEAARVYWMEAAGVPYTQVAAGGNHFAVTAAGIEYRAPARFGDVVRVTAILAQLRSRQVRFEYVVENVRSGVLLVTGYTQHICVDLAGHMAKIPNAILDQMIDGMQRLLPADQDGGVESVARGSSVSPIEPV